MDCPTTPLFAFILLFLHSITIYIMTAGRGINGESYLRQLPKRRKGWGLLNSRNCTDQQLRAALIAVEKGCPVYAAILDFDIPRTTLLSHLMGFTLSRKRGRKPVLTYKGREGG
jgi:hypothetical protein